MKKIIVTAEDINESLCDLDTEYREALAHGLMHYKYISDSPLNLSMGSREKQKELERVMTMPLKSSQLKEIINFISNEMKGDFQYIISIVKLKIIIYKLQVKWKKKNLNVL